MWRNIAGLTEIFCATSGAVPPVTIVIDIAETSPINTAFTIRRF
ncbi:MAG TPA: hypothetical protein VGI60_09945 [Chthoniobacterales bacterium]|jgi:hypothetical protein